MNNWLGNEPQKSSYLSNDQTCGCLLYINFFHSFIRHLWKVSISPLYWWDLKISDEFPKTSRLFEGFFFSCHVLTFFFFATWASTSSHLSRRIFHSILEFFIFMLNIYYSSEGMLNSIEFINLPLIILAWIRFHLICKLLSLLLTILPLAVNCS